MTTKDVKKEIELTEYEFNRLQELTKGLSDIQTQLQGLVTLAQTLTNSASDTQSRRAELLQMLANKYEFSPTGKFTLNEGKIILGVEDAGLAENS